MLCGVSELSWPFPSFCLPVLVTVLSSLAVATGHAVSSITSAFHVPQGEELHSFIMGKAISPSAAVHAANYSFQGQTWTDGKGRGGTPRGTLSSYAQEACLPSNPEGVGRANSILSFSEIIQYWEMDGGEGIKFYLISMVIYLSTCLVEITLNSVENKVQVSPEELLCVYRFCSDFLSCFLEFIHIMSWEPCYTC